MPWSLPRVYLSPRAGGFTRRNVLLAHRIGEKCGRISTVDAHMRAAPVSSLTTSPHISLEEKGLLVERLLKAKVGYPERSGWLFSPRKLLALFGPRARLDDVYHPRGASKPKFPTGRYVHLLL